MNIDNIELPVIPDKVISTLEKVFPNMEPQDIKESTSMISIQRNAAQQEVIDYMRKYAKVSNRKYKHSVWFNIRLTIRKLFK